MRLVVVRTYALSPLAHVDAQMLRAEGIAAAVQDENAVTADLLLPAVGYIKLTVPEADEARARALLDARPADAADGDEPAPLWTCAACGGHDVAVYHPFLWTLLIPVLFPLIFMRRAYCTRCRRTYRLRGVPRDALTQVRR